VKGCKTVGGGWLYYPGGKAQRRRAVSACIRCLRRIHSRLLLIVPLTLFCFLPFQFFLHLSDKRRVHIQCLRKLPDSETLPQVFDNEFIPQGFDIRFASFIESGHFKCLITAGIPEQISIIRRSLILPAGFLTTYARAHQAGLQSAGADRQFPGQATYQPDGQTLFYKYVTPVSGRK